MNEFQPPNPTPARTEVIVPEVLPPESATPPSGAPKVGRVAFHPLSALALVIVDNLWSVPEFVVLDWPFTIPLCFLSVFAITLLIQRRMNRDPWRYAVAKSVLLAILAAIPTSITGTPVGLALLAWAGIRHPWRS